jgi:NADH-quinone oxidoreductase subunit L
MFHLLTHAFFKALLFLGAGIVIHALADEQDVRNMGGLRSALPRTCMLMWVGTIALVGIWPLSKDGILASALQKGGPVPDIVWAGGLIGAFLTGVYALRLMRLVFYGERSEFAKEHLHSGHGEAPWTMFWVVAALAAGALLSGFLAIGFGINTTFGDWLRSAAPAIEPTTGRDLLTTALAWTAGIGGGLIAWRAYDNPARIAGIRKSFAGVATVAEQKFYWDRAYDAIAYAPAAALAVDLYRFIERWVVWGATRVTAAVVRAAATLTSELQNGLVRLYATVLVTGAAVLALFFIGKANL